MLPRISRGICGGIGPHGATAAPGKQSLFAVEGPRRTQPVACNVIREGGSHYASHAVQVFNSLPTEVGQTEAEEIGRWRSM